MNDTVILLTARDPATAHAFKNLIKKLVEHDIFKVYILAQSPGIEIIKENFMIDNVEIKLFPSFLNAEQMIKQADEEIRCINPDIVLTGISGPDYGVDEAILTVANRQNLATYAFQSSWGDINENLPGKPETVFVLDDFAARLTVKRTGRRVVIVGSLKHEYYKTLNVNELRYRFRSKNNISNSDNIIGFYGQPLESVRGYTDTIKDFAHSIKRVATDTVLLYRPHPKETEVLRHLTESILKTSTHRYIRDDDSCIETGLCGCDLIVSSFSTCGYDAQQISRISSEPIGIPMYLLFNKELLEWYCDYSQLDSVPMSNNSMAYEVKNLNVLDASILTALQKQERVNSWSKIRENFSDPSNSSELIIQTLINDRIKINSVNN